MESDLFFPITEGLQSCMNQYPRALVTGHQKGKLTAGLDRGVIHREASVQGEKQLPWIAGLAVTFALQVGNDHLAPNGAYVLFSPLPSLCPRERVCPLPHPPIPRIRLLLPE